MYFLFIRIAALFGHEKARALVRGQKQTISLLKSEITQLQSPIWFHAASVGEFEQARPLIERLRREQPKRQIVVTFFSPSGYNARKEYPLADGVYYLPFATRRNAKRFIAALRPSMAIFVKYEFWPAYIRELKNQNIPTYSISSIFRPHQYFFRWWGKGQLRVLRAFTHLYVQDEASRLLLAKYNINQVSVAGDTRFDRVNEILIANSQKPSVDLRPIADFVQGSERVIVAGSTWPKDEKLLEQYLRQHYDIKLILVPHELNEDHLHYIFNLFKGRMIRYSAYAKSHLLPAVQENATERCEPQVLLIDTIGLLSSIYRFAHTAYIGGGFGEGIHNTIEAATYGIPVVFGPNYHHFREAQGLIDAGASKSIKNYRQFEAALLTALDNHTEIGAKASAYVTSELGATEKIYNEIFSI